MSPVAYEEIKIKKAKEIFENFKDFSSGYRVLFLLQRHKEGGETNNSKLHKIVTRNPEEYFEAIKKLVGEKMNSELPLRVYASVNERDFEKAIRQFKYEQLDADYYDPVQRDNFYLDIKNRFIGCLMQPPQRKTSYFLFDVDSVEGRDVYGELLHVVPDEMITHRYKTKNGWHMITKPFNYTTLKLPEGVEMKKDALLLLDY